MLPPPVTAGCQPTPASDGGMPRRFARRWPAVCAPERTQPGPDWRAEGVPLKP
jgi:hypothetical protein